MPDFITNMRAVNRGGDLKRCRNFHLRMGLVQSQLPLNGVPPSHARHAVFGEMRGRER
jgi:hypothetical protein